MSVSLGDVSVFCGSSDNGGRRVISNDAGTLSAGGTGKLCEEVCGDNTRGVLGNIWSCTMKGFGNMCGDVELVALVLAFLELL